MSRFDVHVMLKENGGKAPTHVSNGPFRVEPRGIAKGGVIYYVKNGRGWRCYRGTQAKCEAWIERMNIAYATYLMLKE